MPDSPSFLNPDEVISRTRNRLPHWQQEGKCYFVTFRLNDSVPASTLRNWMEDRDLWMRHHPKPWSPDEEEEFQDQFQHKLDQWLDSGLGSCLLRHSLARQCLNEVLAASEPTCCLWHSRIVMPNHVHLLFSLNDGVSLESVVKAWKGASARRINQLLGRNGNLWQKDYHDRLIRSETHLERCVQYIQSNPLAAGLDRDEFSLHESDFVRGL